MYQSSFNPFGFSVFSFVPLIGSIIFIVVIVLFITIAVRGVMQWSKNNQSPVLTVEAKVTGKRTHTSHHSSAGMDNASTMTSSHYYATFEVESGDRIEFSLSSQEYAQLAEGDMGRLTFQGTRFQGFARHRA